MFNHKSYHGKYDHTILIVKKKKELLIDKQCIQ